MKAFQEDDRGLIADAGASPASIWSVVLAAGRGRRLETVTEGTPKQFWCDGGRPSFLEQTLARVQRVHPPEHTVIVVDRTHHRYVAALPSWSSAQIVYQPEDRGTAAGVLLGVSQVWELAPDATVLLTPSDHALDQVWRFRSSILEATAAVRSGRMDVVVFGVQPSEPSTDYGWITPGRAYDSKRLRPFRHVVAFSEKPSADRAEALFRSHAVWNTMVLVLRIPALIRLYERHLPGLAAVFAECREVPAERRTLFLEERYPALPSTDFSRDLLAHADDLAVYTWPASMGWSDIGTPERLQQWRDGPELTLSGPERPRRLA